MIIVERVRARALGGQMSVYRVNKLLFDLQMQPNVQEDFKTSFDALADRYRLTPEEARAVREVDATVLSRMGVQPYLLRFFTVAQGVSNVDLIEQLERA
jgi:hypothetical protein